VYITATTAIVLALLLAIEWLPMVDWGLSPAFIITRSLLLVVPLVLLALAVRSPYVAGLAVLLLVAQRAGESADFYPTNPPNIFYPRIAVLDRLPKGGPPYRVTAMDYVFVPNIATMYEVEDVRGYQAMTLDRMRIAQDLFSVPQPVWFNRIDDLTKPFLSALNVRYALAPAGTPAPAGWRHADAQPGVEVFENLRVLPRAFLPRRLVISGDRPFAEMKRETDFSERGWIELRGETRMEIDNARGSVSVRVPDYNRLAIDATLDGDGWLIVSESAWRGWRAKVDGQPARLRVADGVLLGLRLAAGRHHIELRYLPNAFVQGAAISGITALLLLALAGYRLAVSQSRYGPRISSMETTTNSGTS